jgi:hypothetical protein
MTTYSRVGGTIGTWTTTTDWSPTGVSILSGDTAVIPQSIGTPYTVNENFTGTIAALDVSSTTATLNFTGTNQLTVTDLAVNDGTVAVGAGQAFTFGTPVRIVRDAIADGQPHRDLLVSPDHYLFIDDKLIPALMLVNDMTIVREQAHTSAQYFHVELERHGILLAEGLPAESYLDTGNRAMFANAGLALLLHPGFQVNRSLRTWRDDACAPLAVDPATLQPIWQRFAERAQQLGFQPRQLTTTTDPDLHVIVATGAIAPIESSADRYVFVLPRGTDRVVLSSRATRPADIVRYLDDRRKLGIAVGSITLRAGEDMTVFPADRIPACAGWHDHEHGQDKLWRWTGEFRFDPVDPSRHDGDQAVRSGALHRRAGSDARSGVEGEGLCPSTPSKA